MQLGCGSGEDGEGAVQMGRGSGELTVEAVEQGGVSSDVVGCGCCNFTPGNGGEGGRRRERSRGPGHRRPQLQVGPRRVRLSGPPPPAGDATARDRKP